MSEETRVTTESYDWDAIITGLNQYLRLRWETEIREAGRAYNLLLNEMGRAPTPKQSSCH